MKKIYSDLEKCIPCGAAIDLETVSTFRLEANLNYFGNKII